MKSKIKLFHWIISLLLVIVISVGATILVEREKAYKAALANAGEQNETIECGADGKPDGQPLTTEPKQIFYEYIVFEDRVLTRFHYNEEKEAYTYSALNQFFDWLPDGINKHLIIVPSRIFFEEATTTDDSFELDKAINKISAKISDDVNIIDVRDALWSRKHEYIYFRTTDNWTMLGAYYAAECFLNSIGTQIISIDEYYEYKLDGYVGTMQYLDGTDSLTENPDCIKYYMLSGSGNAQIVTAYVSKGEYTQYQSQIIAQSRLGLDIFIGKYVSNSILEGDADNGKTIIVLGDRNSNIFTPWLVPYYETICFVDPEFYYGAENDLIDMIEGYNVTDVLILESVGMFSASTENKKLIRLTGTEIE